MLRSMLCFCMVSAAVSNGLEEDPLFAGLPAGDIALMLAAGEGDVAKVREVMEGGADVNAQNAAGESVLHVSGIKGDVDVLHLLLTGGADANVHTTAPKSLDMTPLHWYVYHTHVAGVRVLLEEGGADVNAVCFDEQRTHMTALDIAISKIANPELEALLKEFGGQVYVELSKEL